MEIKLATHPVRCPHCGSEEGIERKRVRGKSDVQLQCTVCGKGFLPDIDVKKAVEDSRLVETLKEQAAKKFAKGLGKRFKPSH